MANHNATGKKSRRGEELIQRARSAVLNAMDATENRGRRLSEILADELEKNPIKFMELASKLMPKEIDNTHHIGGINELSIAELDQRIENIRKAIGSAEADINSGGEIPASLPTIQ